MKQDAGVDAFFWIYQTYTACKIVSDFESIKCKQVSETERVHDNECFDRKRNKFKIRYENESFMVLLFSNVQPKKAKPSSTDRPINPIVRAASIRRSKTNLAHTVESIANGGTGYRTVAVKV